MRVRRPESRKQEILDAAITLSRRHGYQVITREAIGQLCDCSPATISLYFGTTQNLKRAIMSAAIAREDLLVIAQGLVTGEAKAKAAPPELRRRAMAVLL